MNLEKKTWAISGLVVTIALAEICTREIEEKFDIFVSFLV